MALDHRFGSGSLVLASHLARPPGAVSAGSSRTPGVVLLHGYPSGMGGSELAAASLPELADRIANELGWVALAVAFRGCGGSEGQFALGGWLEDARSAVNHLIASERVDEVWIAGFGTGGAMAVCAAAADPRVHGVAALGAPADFEDWASQPRRLLDHSRDIGLISDAAFPPILDVWVRQLREIRASDCARLIAPRSLLLVHGSDDDVVPVFEARIISDAHGAAELRVIPGAGHGLRHDPRAVAVLLGWLDRERHSRTANSPSPSSPS